MEKDFLNSLNLSIEHPDYKGNPQIRLMITKPLDADGPPVPMPPIKRSPAQAKALTEYALAITALDWLADAINNFPAADSESAKDAANAIATNFANHSGVYGNALLGGNQELYDELIALIEKASQPAAIAIRGLKSFYRKFPFFDRQSPLWNLRVEKLRNGWIEFQHDQEILDEIETKVSDMRSGKTPPEPVIHANDFITMLDELTSLDNKLSQSEETDTEEKSEFDKRYGIARNLAETLIADAARLDYANKFPLIAFVSHRTKENTAKAMETAREIAARAWILLRCDNLSQILDNGPKLLGFIDNFERKLLESESGGSPAATAMLERQRDDLRDMVRSYAVSLRQIATHPSVQVDAQRLDDLVKGWHEKNLSGDEVINNGIQFFHDLKNRLSIPAVAKAIIAADAPAVEEAAAAAVTSVEDATGKPIADLLFLIDEMEERLIDHSENTQPRLGPLPDEAAKLAKQLQYRRDPVVVVRTGEPDDCVLTYTVIDPITYKGEWALTYVSTPDGGAISKGDETKVRKMFERWRRQLRSRSGVETSNVKLQTSDATTEAAGSSTPAEGQVSNANAKPRLHNPNPENKSSGEWTVKAASKRELAAVFKCDTRQLINLAGEKNISQCSREQWIVRIDAAPTKIRDELRKRFV